MITSSSNQQLKTVTALQKKAKERKEKKAFVVEGTKMVMEAPTELLKAVYVSQEYEQDPENEKVLKILRERCRMAEAVFETVSDPVFKNLSDTQTPQGIMAVVRMPEYDIKEMLDGARTHLLVLESIQDPGNLGTMVRTGEGAGITGVIMNKTTVDLFNPKTIRSTMGSIYRVPFYIASDLEETLGSLKKEGVRFYAAHLQGKENYDQKDYTGACGFLIGNEGNGLTKETAELADAYIRIPMEGQVESLNAAIAATLLMYETNRQRRNN